MWLCLENHQKNPTHPTHIDNNEIGNENGMRGEITSTKYKQYKQQNVSNDNGDTRTYILLCMVDKL